MEISPLKSNGIRVKQWGFTQWTQLINKQFNNMSHHYIEMGRQKYLYMSGMFLLNEEIKPKRYAIVK